MDNTNYKPLEADFARFLYSQTTQIPDYLLISYSHLGLSERNLIDLLKVLACCEKGSGYVRFDLLLIQWQEQEQELRAALAALIQQGVLSKAKDTVQECYKLDGLYEKLLELWVFQHSVPVGQTIEQTGNKLKDATSKQEITEVIKAAYQLFEGELARPLSPLEMEKLNCWLTADKWPLAMLREAVQRAVMHGAVSFAYVDKILLRWCKEGINTLEKLAAENDKKPVGNNATENNDNTGSKTAKKKASTKQSNQSAEAGFNSKTDYRKYFGV